MSVEVHVMPPTEAAEILRILAQVNDRLAANPKHDQDADVYRRRATACIAGANALEQLAELDDTPHHVLDVRADGWTLKHPLSCRPHLFECPVNQAAEGFDGPPAAVGRYVVDLDGDGELRIGEEVHADG